MEKEYHIAQFGTYDVESMGDTLFPKGLSFGLSKQCSCTFDLFSMSACEESYNNNGTIYAMSQFAQRHMHHPFDMVILGGGEFLNFNEINFNDTVYPAGYLWEEPIRYARDNNIPVVINCVGVSDDLMVEEKKELHSYLKTVSYLSVRDPFSARRLQTAGIQNCVTVADNLWYMNQMYPKSEMDHLRQQLEQRLGRDFSSPYILVQYGTTKDAKTLAQALRSMKAAAGCRILLMAVNYCHEDRLGIKLLQEQGNGEFEVLDDYLQPPEMIAVISGAKAFLGTSLHGNLTAASYGVPFIGIDMYPSFVSKMDGIFSMLGCESYLVPRETGVEAAFHARMGDNGIEKQVAESIQKMQTRLDAHFAEIAKLLRGTMDGE